MSKSREPDILEVISDLSSDEIFTPPAVANAVLDLLPEDVWSQPDLRWLDPGSKTGVFLREATKRLLKGLEAEIPDEHERLVHILTEMVFGIAITDLTGLMSRRSLYLSKDASGPKSAVTFPTSLGHIWMGRVEHTYVSGRCTICGAGEAEFEREGRENHAYGFIHESGRKAIEELFEMKFDVVVGNPPYQMTGGGGGTNDTPLYDAFVEQAKALSPRYITMIIPSRWMAGGRGLDTFRKESLNDSRFRKIVDFAKVTDVFPSAADFEGGVQYFMWDRDNPGPCEVRYHLAGTVIGPTERKLNEFEIFIRDERAVSILHKVLSKSEPSFSDLMTGDTPFGLATNFADYALARFEGSIDLHVSLKGRRSVVYTDRAVALKNKHLIDVWKVLLPKAYGERGAVPANILGPTLVAAPGSACTQTYLVAGPFDSKGEAESVQVFLRTKFARFVISLRKITQDLLRSTYTWVPQQTWDRSWTDEELYEKYGITEGEQAYIAEMVKEMPA